MVKEALVFRNFNCSVGFIHTKKRLIKEAFPSRAHFAGFDYL